MNIINGENLTKSRKVYRYCKENNIDLKGEYPEVREATGNIVINDNIIGAYHKENIEIYQDELELVLEVNNESIC